MLAVVEDEASGIGQVVRQWREASAMRRCSRRWGLRWGRDEVPAAVPASDEPRSLEEVDEGSDAEMATSTEDRDRDSAADGEAGCGISEEVLMALYRAVVQHADAAATLGRSVGEAVFPVVAAHAEVRTMLPEGLDQVHRGYVRRLLRCDVVGARL